MENRYKIITGTISLLGVSIALYLTGSFGAGISPDSVSYISVARNIADGKGFFGFDGVCFVLQPPLYPLLLAALKFIFHIDPLNSASYVNAFLFGAIIYISGLLFKKNIASPALSYLGVLLVFTSGALIDVSIMAYSEPLFIFLILLFIFYTEKYLAKKTASSLVIISVIASLACLTRYIGVIIVLTGGILIFFFSKSIWKKKLYHLTVFSFISLFPLCLWMLRNYRLTGEFFGWRSSSSYTIPENINFVYNTILPWYFPIELNYFYPIFILLIPTGFAFFVFEYLKTHLHKRPDLNQLIPYIIFVTCYIGFIIISSATTAYDRIDERLLAPAQVATFLILLISYDRLVTLLSYRYKRKYIYVFVTTLFFLELLYPLKSTITLITHYFEPAKWEYNSKSWRDNSTIEYLIKTNAAKSADVYYSNAPEAVYILAGIKTQWLPAKTMYNSPKKVSTIKSLKGIWPIQDTATVVWFYRTKRSFLFSLEDLQEMTNMYVVKQFSDGIIYKITKD